MLRASTLLIEAAELLLSVLPQRGQTTEYPAGAAALCSRRSQSGQAVELAKEIGSECKILSLEGRLTGKAYFFGNYSNVIAVVCHMKNKY
jgi:hypothetical protein